MKLTKQQLKQIVKEECENILQLNENTKSINNFATEIGVSPLGYKFTNQELVDFVNNVLAKSPTIPPIQPEKPDAAKVEAEMKPRWDGETNKHYEQRLQAAIKTATSPATPVTHPLTSTGVGFELEKMLNNRKNKACDPQQQGDTGYDDCPVLYKALEDLRKVVGARAPGSGRAPSMAPYGDGPTRSSRTSAGIKRGRKAQIDRAAARAAQPPESPAPQKLSMRDRFARRLGLREKLTKQQLKQIVKEEFESMLGEAEMSALERAYREMEDRPQFTGGLRKGHFKGPTPEQKAEKRRAERAAAKAAAEEAEKEAKDAKLNRMAQVGDSGIALEEKKKILSEYGGGVGRVEWTDRPEDPSQDVAFMVDGGGEITEDELYDLIEEDPDLVDDADASRAEYNEYMMS
tara:strand:+ start:991 stop:2202 length:1212 start_codon:yes stop_codon:yes gene_type:complete